MNFRVVFVVFVLLLSSLNVFADEKYPSRPITLICPFPAGGATDALLRKLAERASRKLGQPIIVENKPGVSGSLGPNTMARTAKPDGYTISQSTVNVVRIHLLTQNAVDPVKDFTPIAGLAGWNAFGILVRADSKFKTLNDLIEYGKRNPDEITYGTVGLESSNNLIMTELSTKTGAKFLHVPFKGGTESTQALLGGHLLASVDIGWAELEKTGRIRVLATFGESRFKPHIPSAKELGVDVVVLSPFGIVGPKGMDPKVVKLLQDTFRSVMEKPDADLATFMQEQGLVPWLLSNEQYAKWWVDAIPTERKALKAAGLAVRE